MGKEFLRRHGIAHMLVVPLRGAQAQVAFGINGLVQQAYLSHRALRRDRQHTLENLLAADKLKVRGTHIITRALVQRADVLVRFVELSRACLIATQADGVPPEIFPG